MLAAAGRVVAVAAATTSTAAAATGSSAVVGVIEPERLRLQQTVADPSHLRTGFEDEVPPKRFYPKRVTTRG